MKILQWILCVAAVGLLLHGTASAQGQASGKELNGNTHSTRPWPWSWSDYPFNRLCIHNGGEYYVNGTFYNYPNHGGGKYFPSFTHWSPTPIDNAGLFYPWKLAGWCWTGMKGYNNGNYSTHWYWDTCLQKSEDNPYATTMSWDYPAQFCKGVVPCSGGPNPIYYSTVPSSVPHIGGDHSWVFPSSTNGFDSYLNIFAVGVMSLQFSWTAPLYGFQFGFIWDCASAVTVPSNSSIWQYVWSNKGDDNQYLVLSGNEVDCVGGPGNKGRNYSIISDSDNGCYWYWNNKGPGVSQEWAMCLFVCDAVTIPVNVPGDSGSANPFCAYGFDVGSTTLFPYIRNDDKSRLGFMSEDYTGSGGSRIVLGSMAYLPCIGPYGENNYRLPHGWDFLTNILLNVATLFQHTPVPGYPTCMFGTTTGAHSLFVPIKYDSSLSGMELRFSTYATGTGSGQRPPTSASYMVTFF